MNGLIRYKDNCINLDKVITVTLLGREIWFVLKAYNQHEPWEYVSWNLNTTEEAKKVYNYILDNYFTDIEKEMNK